MSRLSEILGVPEGREFKFYKNQNVYSIANNAIVYSKDEQPRDWFTEFSSIIYVMIEHPDWIRPIPDKPSLTNQQITAIKGRIAEGTPWAARDKDSDNTIYFFPNKPRTNSAKTSWHAIERTDLVFVTVGSNKNNLYDFITYDNSPVYLPDLIEGSEGE